MAHRIFTHDKQQGIEQAWHGLTHIMSDLSLEKNWLRDWDIVPVPLEKRGQPSKYSVLECTDNPEIEIGLPYNPKTFTPIDNAAFLALVEESIGGAGHKVYSVGSVRNRGRVFVSIELCGMEKFVAAGRETKAFLNFGNGHDKSSVLFVNTSNIATVCDNTYSANLFMVEQETVGSQKEEEEQIRVSVRHTKNAKMKFPSLTSLIEKACGVQAVFTKALNEAQSVALNTEDARAGFAGFVTSPDAEVMSSRTLNRVDRLTSLFSSGRGNKGQNLADMFNAVTDFYTHESSGGDNRMRQFLSSEYGDGAKRKAAFFSVVRKPEEKLQPLIERGRTLIRETAKVLV